MRHLWRREADSSAEYLPLSSPCSGINKGLAKKPSWTPEIFLLYEFSKLHVVSTTGYVLWLAPGNGAPLSHCSGNPASIWSHIPNMKLQRNSKSADNQWRGREHSVLVKRENYPKINDAIQIGLPPLYCPRCVCFK